MYRVYIDIIIVADVILVLIKDYFKKKHHKTKPCTILSCLLGVNTNHFYRDTF